MFNYPGVNLKINDYRLTRMGNAYMMLQMTVLLIDTIIALLNITNKKHYEDIRFSDNWYII